MMPDRHVRTAFLRLLDERPARHPECSGIDCSACQKAGELLGSFEHELNAAVKRMAAERLPAGTLGNTPTRGLRRARVIALFGAAALLLVASAATAQRMLYPDVPEPELEAAIHRIWSDRNCVPPAEARAAMQRELDGLGYSDWTIGTRPGTYDASCASVAVLATLHELELMPGMSSDVATTSAVLVDGLLRECLGRADAIQFVTSVLTTAGSDPFSVRADPWGPQAGPADKIEAYRAHVDAGCFVYVGAMTRDSEGRAVHHLWGPFP